METRVWDVSWPDPIKEAARQQKLVDKVSDKTLITALYKRGYTIDDMFGYYYALQEADYHNDDVIHGSSEAGRHGKSAEKTLLTVGDVELVGHIKLPSIPNKRVGL